MMGNVFWDDPLVLKEVGNSLIGGTTAAMTAGDSDDPEVTAYLTRLGDSYGKEIAGLGPSVFTYGYYTAGQALVKGLEAVDGDVSDQKALQDALAEVTLSGDEAPYGDVKLDDNRQAISNVFVKRIVKDKTGDGVPDVETFRRIPDVDQTFGGFFSAETPGAGSQQPEVREARPAAVGGQGGGGLVRAADVRRRNIRRARRADPPVSGDRPALRRRRSRRRRRPDGRRRRAAGDPGAERRREDHAVQPDLGGVPAERGDRGAVRAGRHGDARPNARPHGAVAHVPDLAPVRRPERGGQPLPGRARRAGRAPSPGQDEGATRTCATRPARWRGGGGTRRPPGRDGRRAVARRAAAARGRRWRASPSPS